MRLSTFIADDGRLRTGAVLTGERLLDFTSVATSLPFDGADMLSLIASGQAGLDAASELVARHPDGTHDLHAVRLLAPIPRPRKNIFCVGWNYLEHFEESKKLGKSIDLPAFPTFFSKPPTTANGPYDAVTIDPAISEMIDWEAELALVIGSAGSNIGEEQASAHVFGYMVLNDVSAREVQRRHGGQWFKGKSLDGFAPMGPWIVTADELDPSDLRISTRVNGITMQDSSTSCLYFKIPRIIAELSRGMTLEPGDIISTGTPEGVGFARQPPQFLQPGDMLETEVEGIGVLKNRIELAK
jgi:2-keto-4-pentenoate hydratase/2-oxohepta-3-ene-1,7-dioic acid hydratase in catechol pathway